MTFYADMAGVEEDKPIEAIGNVMTGGAKSSADKPIMATKDVV